MGRMPDGFSMVEALVVLGIAALGVALALPPFDDTLRRNRVTASMHALMTDMAMARSTAVMRGAQVVLCPGSAATGCDTHRDWSSGWIVYLDEDGNRRPDHPDDVLRVTGPPAGAGALLLRSTRPYLRYQADGRSAHSNLTVNVCAADALEGRLVVSNLGRVRSERPTRALPCPAT